MSSVGLRRLTPKNRQRHRGNGATRGPRRRFDQGQHGGYTFCRVYLLLLLLRLSLTWRERDAGFALFLQFLGTTVEPSKRPTFPPFSEPATNQTIFFFPQLLPVWTPPPSDFQFPAFYLFSSSKTIALVFFRWINFSLVSSCTCYGGQQLP